MKDPNNFTVAALKEKLRSLNLMTSGNKAELILRLSRADPSGQWMEDMDPDADTEYSEDGAGGMTEEDFEEQRRRFDRPVLFEKELEFARRENELMKREMELMRRENEFLQSSRLLSTADIEATVRRSENMMPKINLTNLKEMLPEFDGKKESYRRWEEQLLLVKKMYNLDDNFAKLLLGAKLTGNAADWFHSIPGHLLLSMDELLNKMRLMFDKREKRLSLRKEFENRVWLSSETFSEYFHKKLILANKVPIDEEEIVDYLIEGIPVKVIKHQAMMQQFVNKEAMLKAMQEISLYPEKVIDKNMKSFSKNGVKTMEVSKKHEDNPELKHEVKCFNCNTMGHIAAKCQMPKREKGACFKCYQLGHKSKECSAKESKINNTKDAENKKKDVNSVFEENEDFRRDVSYQFCDDDGQNKVVRKLDTLLDTGSPVSFVRENFVPENLIISVLQGDSNYSGINGSLLKIKGRVMAKIALNNKEEKIVSLMVVPITSMKAAVVIGRDILRKFYDKVTKPTDENIDQVIIDILNIEINDSKDKIEDSLNINSDLTSETKIIVKKIFVENYVNPVRPEMPVIDAELKLILREEKPFHFNPRRLSYVEKSALRKLLDTLLEKKIIRASESEYASPIVLVRKKTGDIRLCVDFRELNKLLVKDNYPLPNIEDLIDSLYGKKYFTIFDLKDGFYHIKLAEESIKYTAFTTFFGQYEFVRMPFGLKVAPSRFQRYVNQILADLIRESKVVVYMDDILVSSVTLEEHFTILKEIFKKFVDNYLVLRIDKCKFLQTEIEFVGYLISEKGISPTKQGVIAVQKIPIPRNIKEVQSFVALCSYFRKFIQSFSLIAKPLYDLLRKNVKFTFEKKELDSFEKLKRKLIEAPVLAIYNPNNETELHCDASAIGFGAVLLQRGKDKQFHPVFFFSKRTTEAEAKYHSFELEMLAIVYALRRFRVYVSGIRFKIITDCNALALALKKKDINPKIGRWILELLNYDYITEHRPGSKMSHVDALSRLPIDVLVIEDNSFELNLSLSQSRDKKLCELREILIQGEDAHFEMRNGIIYKKHDKDLLFYVPQAMEFQVLNKYHDQMGHLGIEKTFETILKSYWFPCMKQKIKNYISNCLKCIAFSPLTGKKEGYLHSIPKGQIPFETYHIDHYGPIDKDRLTKRYLLVVVDAFSKFTKLYPTKSTTTNEVINNLTLHFCNYSRPRIIISDRGTAFTSGEFQEFCKENDIQHVRIATFSPKANGQVERTNRVLGPMISKLIDNDEKKYWYKIISDIEFAINNSVHKTTNETPSKLLFGINQKGKIIDKIREYLENTVNENDRDLKSIRERAAKRIEKSQKYNKEYFDKKRKKANVYKIDDYVMIRNIDTTKGVSQKIIPEFKGPYKISKVLRNDRYVVKDIENYQVTNKPYQGTWEAVNLRPYFKDESFETITSDMINDSKLHE